MSCYACTRKYGMFCKESGCNNCGYSFCLKCLKKEIEVPRHNNQKEKVCLRCYEKLFVAAREAKKEAEAAAAAAESGAGGGVNAAKAKLEPNEIFQITDLSDSLDPVLQPISLTANTRAGSDANSEEIAGNLDSEILNRLKNLKTADTLPGDEELRSRLCNLQGIPAKDYSKKDVLLPTDHRSEQEKINDLLKQFVEEADIDSNTGEGDKNSLSEIERRLAALRDMDANEETRRKPTVDPNTPSDNEEDDETLLKNIIQRYVDEARLPNAPDGNLANELAASIPVNAPAEATEELPWCTICNEDAVLRCETCGGDLFCRGCFKECHQDDEEWRNHVTQTYSKPPTFKEDHF